ncbi:hypothetical protein [Devosia sp. MC532]|nr:hypothetical protein [Devosia sp. MC532]
MSILFSALRRLKLLFKKFVTPLNCDEPEPRDWADLPPHHPKCE